MNTLDTNDSGCKESKGVESKASGGGQADEDPNCIELPMSCGFSSSDETDDECEFLSKKEVKKKREEMKRKIFKEKKKQKKQQQKVERMKRQDEKWKSIGSLGHEDAVRVSQEQYEHVKQIVQNRMDVKQKMSQHFKQVYEEEGCGKNITVVLDCSFDSLMNDKEIASLSHQIMFCYSNNKKMACERKPLYFCLTSLSETKGGLAERMKFLKGFENWNVDKSSKNFIDHLGDQKLPKENIIYLTADSPNELDELKEGYAYVIGAIVDRNRHKSICFNRAEEMGINTAKFPIGKYVKLKSSTVLTTNQCFEIIQQYAITKNWKSTIENVIPIRKIKEVESESK